jgi:putative ABC transport system permease protein
VNEKPACAGRSWSPVLGPTAEVTCRGRCLCLDLLPSMLLVNLPHLTGTMRSLVNILQSAVRRLRRTPTFAMLAVGMLGLGIGSVTSMTAITNQVVLQPLPIHDQDRVIVAWSDNHGRNVERFPYFPPVYEAVKDGASAFAGIAAVRENTSDLVVEDVGSLPHTLQSSPVLGDFFGVLGVQPIIGRTLGPDDDVTSPPELLANISERLWGERYGRSPDVLGQALVTRNGTYTIVGVLPGDFDYPRGADVWMPMRPLYGGSGDMPLLLELDLVGRLAPGATIAGASAQLTAAVQADPRLAQIYADADPVLRPFSEVVLGDLSTAVLVLLAGGALLLFVAALNVANLVLVRAEGRRDNMAVRRALGATRWHLFRDAVADASVLGISGAAVGAGIALLAVRSLALVAPPSLYRLDQVRGLDPTSFLVAVGVSVLAVFGAVVLPLWRVERLDPSSALRGAGRGSRARGRMRQVLVSAQIALTVWVLVVGTLVIRTSFNLQALDLGFRPDDLVAVSLSRDRTEDPASAVAQRLGDALQIIRASPGVVGATHLLSAPLSGTDSYRSIMFLEGQSREEALDANPYMYLQVIEPDGFDVLGMPVIEGRGFSSSEDVGGDPVVVLNAAAAHALWPGSDALGKRVRAPIDPYLETWWTVAGVVADTRYDEFLEPKPVVYFSIEQFSAFLPSFLLVRTDGSRPPTLRLVHEALERSAPSMSVKTATPVRSTMDGPLERPRFTALVLSVFGVVTLILAAVGIYGVMGFLVRSRRREIGIRLACGASPRMAGMTVLRTALLLTALGAALGAAGAWVSAGLFETLLFGVVPSDLRSLVVAVAVTTVCVLAACWVPASQAARVSPSLTLRSD